MDFIYVSTLHSKYAAVHASYPDKREPLCLERHKVTSTCQTVPKPSPNKLCARCFNTYGLDKYSLRPSISKELEKCK